MAATDLPLPEKSKTWQGYSAATTEDRAIALFRQKYGRSPSEVKRNGGALLLGPLTDAEVAR